MSESSQFTVEIDGHVAWLTMNRPETRNTMGTHFFQDLINGKLPARKS